MKNIYKYFIYKWNAKLITIYIYYYNYIIEKDR